MNLANKTFKNNVTGEIIKVIDSFENIVILENKQRIDIKSLMDVNKYTEQIDPANFFKNQGAYDILSEKIKNIPTHLMNDDNTQSIDINADNSFYPNSNESAIVMTTEEDEKAELAKKYGASIDNTNSLKRQNDAFSKILGEDSEDVLPEYDKFIDSKNVERIEVDQTSQQPTQRVKVEDPIITMFSRTKRNVEFKINIEVSDKIPRLDFIEMMEDSYEISMIDFLADEFTNKILQDPSSIRESIKDKIKQLVYGAPISHINTTNKEEISTDEDSKDISTIINGQITDSVTQAKVEPEKVIKTEPKMVNEAGKKTTTRKPRAKKETVEK